MVAPVGSDHPTPLSKHILNRLRAGAGTQRRNSLNRLEGACDALERAGTIITFESVGQECRHRFKMGPYPQSIRNDSGFKEYVSARKNEQSVDQGNKGAKRKPELLARIETIEDPALRARLRLLCEENRETNRRLQQIQAGLKLLAPGIDIQNVLRGGQTGTSVPHGTPDANSVDPLQVQALETLLKILTNEADLKRHSLEYDGHRVQRNKPPYTPLIPNGIVGQVIALHAALTGSASDERVANTA